MNRGERAHIDVAIKRQDREGARRFPRFALAVLLQPLQEAASGHARGAQHRLWMFAHQILETGARETQQFRITQRAHRHRARLAADQAQFVHRRVARNHAQQTRTAARLRHAERAEAAAAHQVHRIRCVATLQQRGAARRREPRHLRGERIQFVSAQMPEHLAAPKQRVQIPGTWRVHCLAMLAQRLISVCGDVK